MKPVIIPTSSVYEVSRGNGFLIDEREGLGYQDIKALLTIIAQHHPTPCVLSTNMRQGTWLLTQDLSLFRDGQEIGRVVYLPRGTALSGHVERHVRPPQRARQVESHIWRYALLFPRDILRTPWMCIADGVASVSQEACEQLMQTSYQALIGGSKGYHTHALNTFALLGLAHPCEPAARLRRAWLDAFLTAPDELRSKLETSEKLGGYLYWLREQLMQDPTDTLAI